MNTPKISILLLRIGLALVFLYVAVSSFLDPNSWVGFFPPFLRDIFGDALLLNGFSIYEILLGLWLLWGRYAFYSAALSALTLLGIIVPNLGAMDIIFRDVGLLFMAAALAILNKEYRS